MENNDKQENAGEVFEIDMLELHDRSKLEFFRYDAGFISLK